MDQQHQVNSVLQTGGISSNSILTNYYIRWVCQNVKGSRLLFIGEKNLDLFKILLREELDISIINADESVITELKDRVRDLSVDEAQEPTIKKIDIHKERIDSDVFDSIILSNIIEFSFSPNQILKKIDNSLSIDGQFLMALPYGINFANEPINNHFGFRMAIELSKIFSIKGIELLDSKRNQSAPIIGFICGKKTSNELNLEQLFNIIQKLELEIEEYCYGPNIARINDCTDYSANYQHGSRSMSGYSGINTPTDAFAISEKTKIIGELEKNLINLTNQIVSLKKTNDDLQNKVKGLDNKALEINSKYNSLKNENSELSNKTKDAIQKLNRELKEEERILRSYEKLNKEYDRIYKKYDNLAETFWGKLTLEYWRFLKNRPRD